MNRTRYLLSPICSSVLFAISLILVTVNAVRGMAAPPSPLVGFWQQTPPPQVGIKHALYFVSPPQAASRQVSAADSGKADVAPQIKRMSVEKQPQDKSVEATEALTNNLPNGCVIGELHAAPQGQWMAVQVNCTDKGFVQVMHAASGQIRSIGANLGQDSFFLDWMPSGNEVILKVDTVGTPRIYRVNLANDKAESLPVPATTYDVAISPNGKRMIYSLTRGLGYGGETWIAGTNGQNAKRVLVDPTHITAFARWSPSGNQIAYIVMPDSNIPFTVGDLWIMDAVGNNSVLLGEVDTGHGYPPVWSPDGSQIAFVGRENRNDKKADHLADRLISNIYTVNVKDRTVSAVTQFTDALTESPVWSPDGELLAFSTNAGGSAGVWVFGAEDKTLRRMTFGISALHPAWLPEK